MGYTNFLIWAGKQGFKYGQKYLFKAWKEAEKLGKPIAEKHFPKLINKAKDYYKNFKTFDPKVVPKEIVKPKRFKWDDAGPGSAFDKRLRAIVDKHKAQIKPENLNAANTSRFVTGAKEGITGIKPPGFNPSVIKGGKKAEGGIMTASYGYDDAMAESRSAYEDALKKGTIPLDMEFEEFLDISNESYAQGGRANFDDGGPSQKDIDKGLKAIEKLKSSLMPESYEELIEIYKDKQKDLNIDIMEDAGGLGEMLGEGGRTGYQGGDLVNKWKIIKDLYDKVGGVDQNGEPISIDDFAVILKTKGLFGYEKGGRVGMYAGGLAAWLAKQGPKVWKWANKPGNNPYDLYKKYLKSVKTRAQAGDMKSLAPELGAVTAGGIMANRWASKKLKEGLDLSEEEKKRKWWERGPGAYSPEKAEGGRIGMMYGGDPGFAFSYGGSWADWKENHASEMPVMDYINQKLPKARNPFTDARYDSGGPVKPMTPEEFSQLLFQKPYNQLKPSEQQEVDGFTSSKAEGGRIGFQEGTGIMSQTGIPYYADKAVEGIVNSAETLSKLPFAAGKLGSQLLQSPPDKKMFSEAVENITPGSWSKNLGISSLAEAEGAKVSGKQRVIGDVLGLGTEMAVPVGGAFKIGQKIIDQASKVIGKLKKGKTLDQTINDKITDFGQSRRDFNATVAASGLMVALKGIGLGGLFKAAPTKDFAVKLKTYWHNSDVDYGTSGLAHFDLTALTAPVRTALKSIMNKAQKFKHGNYGKKLSGKEYINIDPGDTKFIVKELQKKGFTGKFTGIADEGGDVLKQAEKAGQKDFVKTYKKQSMKQNVKDHQLYSDYVVYENDPGFLHWSEATKGKLNKPFVSTIDEVVEILEPVVKKGEGGIIEDDEFREFLDDRKNRDKDNFQRDFFEDFKKWKKWKEGNIQEAKDGGRMWQPKSAPQLTTTIPPESGPMPHGLTYLTGDDIVQNIGHKHGRN